MRRGSPTVLEMQERAGGPLSPCQLAKFGGALISPAAGAANNVEFFVCLFVCLFVTILNVRVCAPDFAMKVLETGVQKRYRRIGEGLQLCTRVQLS